MSPFIKKYEYNFVAKCLYDLNNAFRNCTDKKIVESTKAYIGNKIYAKFDSLSEEERKILDITKIVDPLQIEGYLKEVRPYVYGMKIPTSKTLTKLFKKEKKLKLPDLSEDKTLVYLGFIDPSIRKLLIAYDYNGSLLGMSCRLSDSTSNNTNVCTLCNHIGKKDEVAFVSPICKTSSKSLDAYKSIGFYICLDSEKCNERITSTEKLEDLLKKVNNIK